jgi:hypothetical protein
MSANGERLATGFDWWLQKEAELARAPTSRNQIHDDFAMLREGYTLPFGHPDNRSLGKAAGHLTRFHSFLTGLIDGDFDMRDERVSARLVHHSLMFTAGGARISTALQSQSQQEYEQKRFMRPWPHDIDLLPVVEEVVDEVRPQGYNGAGIVAVQGLIMRSRIYSKHKLTGDWFSAHLSRAYTRHYPTTPPVEHIRGIQREGVRMAATIAIVAAAEQGIDIKDVAILEPKSVTDVGPPIHPLRDQFEYEGDILELHGRTTVPNRYQSFNSRRAEQNIAA